MWQLLKRPQKKKRKTKVKSTDGAAPAFFAEGKKTKKKPLMIPVNLRRIAEVMVLARGGAFSARMLTRLSPESLGEVGRYRRSLGKRFGFAQW